MEEDIQNYSLTVMFRGTPCTSNGKVFLNNKKVDVKSNPGQLQGPKDVPVSLQIFFSIF